MEQKKRCAWVNLRNENYISYHDREWGKPSHDEAYLYEMLLLECFQAGLSWEIILNKRENFREAFDGFDPGKIRNYGEEKIAELLENPQIVRNRLKIGAAIKNADVFLKIQEEYGTFDRYIWSFSEGKTVVNMDDRFRTTSELSDQVSKDLKKRGMRFAGSTTIYSYLQAIGVINDHELDCAFRGE